MARKIVFVGNAGGGVLSRLTQHEIVRTWTFEAVSDRDCGFLGVATRHGLPAVLLSAESGLAFSDLLKERYGDREDLIFLSFYSRLFRGSFLDAQGGRIFNCHPSLLPAFKGMHGFEDTLASTARFMGCTLHQIDAGMDSGPNVIQVALPLDRTLPYEVNRHRIFLAQYYSALQFLRWAIDGRMKISPEGPVIEGAKFQASPFSPNLDSDFFSFFEVLDELA